ncbi:MAG: hypothetical protein V4622_06185 [Bacteroidota bacterium]
MKTVFFLTFIILCSNVFSQKKHVRENLWRLKNEKDIYSDLIPYKPDTNRIEFFKIDTARIQAIFTSAILKSIRKNDTIQFSSILTKFAKITCNYFSKHKYKYYKQLRIDGKFKKALPYLSIKFGLLYRTSFTFNINNSKKPFYYDKSDGRSEFNLYSGIKEQKSSPLLMISELELKNLIIKELSSDKIIRENGLRNFSYVGYSFYFIKQKKDKIPKIRVIVYFGGKRLKLVKNQ